MPHVKTGKPVGRPSKKNTQALARILKVARTGLPLKFAAQAGNIDLDTLGQWRARDPEFALALSQARLAAVEEKWKLIQKAAEDRVDADGKLLKAGDWRSLAWSLERAYPAEFARPEVALNVGLQNNVTQNHLTIVVSPDEIRELEEEAQPVRQKIKEMYAAYRPALGNGNGDVRGKDVAVVVLPSVKTEELAPIVRKEGDENSSAFWNQFVTGDSTRPVERATAVFVVRTVVSERLGAHRCGEIRLEGGTVTVEDVLHLIDKKVGTGDPAGWRHLLKKAGQI
jgi:hypothetical protein